MRCLMCGKETANPTDHNVCTNCEETCYKQMIMESGDTDRQSGPIELENRKRPWAPASYQGKWSVFLAIFTLGMLIAAIFILSSKALDLLGPYPNPQIILSIAVILPAIMTIVLASRARSRAFDDSILTTIAWVAGMTLLAVPILLWVLIFVVLLTGGFHVSFGDVGHF